MRGWVDKVCTMVYWKVIERKSIACWVLCVSRNTGGWYGWTGRNWYGSIGNNKWIGRQQLKIAHRKPSARPSSFTSPVVHCDQTKPRPSSAHPDAGATTSALQYRYWPIATYFVEITRFGTSWREPPRLHYSIVTDRLQHILLKSPRFVVEFESSGISDDLLK